MNGRIISVEPRLLGLAVHERVRHRQRWLGLFVTVGGLAEFLREFLGVHAVL